MFIAAVQGAKVALKRIPKAKLTRDAVAGMTDEIVMMQQLRHPNIVTFIGCCFDPCELQRVPHAQAASPLTRSSPRTTDVCIVM